VKGEKEKSCAAIIRGELLLQRTSYLKLRSDANHLNPHWRKIQPKESAAVHEGKFLGLATCRAHAGTNSPRASGKKARQILDTVFFSDRPRKDKLRRKLENYKSHHDPMKEAASTRQCLR
jgi:hypothetical protein